MSLDYNINAQAKPRTVNARVLEIGGQAIDCSVNANNWQVPPEELDYFIANSQNVQVRVNHGDRVEDVKGAINFLRAGRWDSNPFFEQNLSLFNSLSLSRKQPRRGSFSGLSGSPGTDQSSSSSLGSSSNIYFSFLYYILLGVIVDKTKIPETRA